MPLKLNVGLSRKVGQANYGSRGASVHLELELDASLAGEPDRLQDRIRQMFRLARESVDEELGGHLSDQPTDNGHDQPSRRLSGQRPATESQVRAIHAIAGRQRTDLARLVQERFGVRGPEELSIGEASQLIDELKAQGNGAGGRR